MVSIQIMKFGKIVGVVDTETKRYSKIVDFSKSQGFFHPKYRNSIGISKDIIRRIASLGVKTLDFWVLGLEVKPFRVIISLSEFLSKGKEVYFGEGNQIRLNADQQVICQIENFTRIYAKQQVF